MKNVKKVLAATALSGAVLVGAGFGTYSWFSAEKTSTGSITNGTLTLGDMANSFSHTNFAPSQIKHSEWITLNNTGSLSQNIKFSYDEKLNKADIGKYTWNGYAIKMKKNRNLNPLQKGLYESALTALLGGGNVVSKGSNEVDLPKDIDAQLIVNNSSSPQAAVEAAVAQLSRHYESEGWSLAPDEKYEIILAVKLDNNAGNDFQGAVYGSTFKANGKQTDNRAKYTEQ